MCAEEVHWTDLDYARVHLNSTLYIDVHVKLNTVLLWQNQHSTGRRLFSPTNWT